jgi:DNA repair photolyase
MTTPVATSRAHYSLVDARSLLRETALVDPWFLGRFGLNLYRGCEHGCVYCDGRAERYYVEGDFARDIQIKSNALALAERELARPREPGFLFVGGGVSDGYQPAEAEYQLARGMLGCAARLNLPVHVLTKSSLVERDFDLLCAINRDTRAIVSFSLQTTDDDLRLAFEPGASSVAERLRLLAKARASGISGGIMAMPVLPGLSDSSAQIGDLVRRAADNGAEYVCFAGLTLRPGRQKEYYYARLRSNWSDLVAGYDRAYRRNLASGAPDPRYVQKVTERFAEALTRANLPARIPRKIFSGIVPQYTEASVLLEHAETAALLAGIHRPLGRSGQKLAEWARKRVVVLKRRKGFDYRDVEVEFAERTRDGSLREIEGFTDDALTELRRLGFGSHLEIGLFSQAARQD